MEFVDDSRSSMSVVYSLLALQPNLIAHLLRVANNISKPTTIKGIIAALGSDRIAEQLKCVSDAPPEEAISLRLDAIKSYIVARVFAALAEKEIGKQYAPEFFLVGLLHKIFEEDTELLEDCNAELIRCFKGEGAPNWPKVAKACELVETFRTKDCGHDTLYLVWKDANRSVRAGLNGF